MPKGDLLLFDEGTFNGSIDVQSFTKMISLNNVRRNSSYLFELEKHPAKLYAIVSTERGSKTMPKLRMWINDFSLSKELKPNVEVTDGNSVFSTIIYDISPFGKDGRNELNLVRTSMDTLNLINVTLVSFYPDEDLKNEYKLNAGTLMLSQDESLTLENIGRGILVLGGKRGSAKVYTDKDEYSSNYFMESDELEVLAKSKVKVVNESGNGTLVFFYATFSTSSPEIRLEPRLTEKDNTLLLSVRNQSDVALDKMIMNLTVNGITRFFKIYSPLDPNQEVIEKIEKAGINLNNVNLRVVGIKSGMRIVIDTPLTK